VTYIADQEAALKANEIAKLRFEAAKAAMQGMLAGGAKGSPAERGDLHMQRSTLAMAAVGCADALLAKLGITS